MHGLCSVREEMGCSVMGAVGTWHPGSAGPARANAARSSGAQLPVFACKDGELREHACQGSGVGDGTGSAFSHP